MFQNENCIPMNSMDSNKDRLKQINSNKSITIFINHGITEKLSLIILIFVEQHTISCIWLSGYINDAILIFKEKANRESQTTYVYVCITFVSKNVLSGMFRFQSCRYFTLLDGNVLV